MNGNMKKLTILGIMALLVGLISIGTGALQADDDDLNSVKLWSTAGLATSPGGTVIIATKSVSLEFEAGDTAVLSSTPDGLGFFFTDNFININGTNVCPGGSCFAGFVSPPPFWFPIPPLDVSPFIPVGDDDGPPVVFDWVDVGGIFASSDVYLVTTADIEEDDDDDSDDDDDDDDD